MAGMHRKKNQKTTGKTKTLEGSAPLEVEVLTKSQRIDELIQTFDQRYRDMKMEAELKRIRQNARWFSFTKEEYMQRVEDQSRIPIERLDLDGVLPPFGYYTSELAPSISTLSKEDIAKFESISELSIKAIQAILDAPIPEAATKRFVTCHFFDQYFRFLHRESDNIVLAVARMQGQRANLNAEKDQGADSPLNDNPFEDRNIMRYIGLFRDTSMEEHLPAFANLCAGMDNGIVLEKYMRNLPEIISRLRKESSIITGRYIRLAQAQKFPGSHQAFDFNDPKSIDDLSYFDNAGRHAQKTEDLFALMLEKDVVTGCASERPLRRLVDIVIKLDKCELSAEVSTLLDEAIWLTRLDLSGMSYLSSIENIKRNTRNNRGPFLRYIGDLANLNTRCASSYMFRNGDDFALNPESRERYLNVGLRMAREFGDSISDYFESGRKILEIMPRKFASWLEQITNLGHDKQNLLHHSIYPSVRALELGLLEEMLAVSAYFDNRIQEMNKKMGPRCLDIIQDTDFFMEYLEAKEHGVSPWKHAENALHLIEHAGPYGHASLLRAVGVGIDYNRYAQIFPALVDNCLLNIEPEGLKELVNSDMSYFEKERILRSYRLSKFGSAFPIHGAIDIDGAWKNDLKERSIRETSDYLGIDTSRLDQAELELLLTIKSEDYGGRSPDDRLRYLVEERLKGERILKNFERGKVYGSARSDQKHARFDRLEMRMQEGELRDIADGMRFRSHYFFTRGNFKAASFNYVLHEDVGLLHLIPGIGEATGDPIGVALCIRAQDKEKQRILLVDSVEAGPLIKDFTRESWIPALHQSIMSLAEDSGSNQVLYNARVLDGIDGPAENVITYLRKMYNAKEVNIHLTISQSSNLVRFVQSELEFMERIKSGGAMVGDEDIFSAQEKLRQIETRIHAYTGLVLQSWGGADIMNMNSSYLPGELSGHVQGLLFDVPLKLPSSSI